MLATDTSHTDACVATDDAIGVTDSRPGSALLRIFTSAQLRQG